MKESLLGGSNAMKLPAVHLRSAVRDRQLVLALLAEFVGTALYQVIAGSVTDSPLESALVYTALLFATKPLSGGHLNPAISLAGAASGHIDWTRGITYTVAQVLGAIAGAMLQVAVGPYAKFGKASSPGCFAPGAEMHRGMTFGWEVILTFVLVWVAYNAIFVQPGYGDIAPLAIGITLAGALATGGDFVGHAPLNPARVLASALVFKCWSHAWTYMFAHALASAVASILALATFGRGMYYEHGQRTSPAGATEQLREGLLGGGSPGVGERV